MWRENNYAQCVSGVSNGMYSGIYTSVLSSLAMVTKLLDSDTKDTSGGNKIVRLEWNKRMRYYNGNGDNTINVGHWNCGGSYIAKSVSGKNKLQQIKNILDTHDLDILGISEANVCKDVNSYEYSIDGYNVK